MQLDHVRTRNDFIKHCERRWSFRTTHTFALLLFRERDFNFDFTQSFDERFYSSSPQRLD
jgi:hypothetical protein